MEAAAAKSLQSCPTLCDPRDGSPPGSPAPGILQARALEWVAIAFSVEAASYSYVLSSGPASSTRNLLSLPSPAEGGLP